VSALASPRTEAIIASTKRARHNGGIMAIKSHNAYIAAAPEQFHAILSQLRAQIAQALPDAEEVIKYDMPGFEIEGAIVAGYAAFSKQCGLYVDPAAIAAHADEITGSKLKSTKTGVTFSAKKPIPDALVRKLVTRSRREKDMSSAMRP